MVNRTYHGLNGTQSRIEIAIMESLELQNDGGLPLITVSVGLIKELIRGRVKLVWTEMPNRARKSVDLG